MCQSMIFKRKQYWFTSILWEKTTASHYDIWLYIPEQVNDIFTAHLLHAVPFIYIRSKTRGVNEKCSVYGKFQRILNPQFHFQLYISKTEGWFCCSPHYKHYLKGTFESNRSETWSRFHRRERSAPILLLTFLRNTSKACSLRATCSTGKVWYHETWRYNRTR